MPYVDFNDLKAKVSIDQCVQMLGLKMVRKGPQYRGECVACKSGGDRALAVNSDNKYYCFADKKGGDQIALVAHIRGISAREAAETISTHFGVATVSQNSTSPTNKVETGGRGALKPLEDLDVLHEAVEGLGVSPAAADEIGMGYATVGYLRGRVGVPVRSSQGELLGYFGIAPGADVIFHKSITTNAENVVEFKKKA